MIVLAHVRELANQIYDVYSKICEFSDITVINIIDDNKTPQEHVVITTIGKLM